MAPGHPLHFPLGLSGHIQLLAEWNFSPHEEADGGPPELSGLGFRWGTEVFQLQILAAFAPEAEH